MNRSKNISYKISNFIEFNIKQTGLFTGLFFLIVVMPILFGIDRVILNKYELIRQDHYTSLVAFNNGLSSILISILLTTFSVVFVVMQLASSQFLPRILRYFMANDLRIQRFIGVYLCGISSIFFIQIFSTLYNDRFQLCLFISLLLSFYCILINFPNVIIHLNDNMNVATITSKIKEQVIEEIEILYADKWQNNDLLLYKRLQVDLHNMHALIYWGGKSGYLSEVNYSELSVQVTQFINKNVDIPPFKIHQKPIVGEFIMHETTVVLVIEFESAVKAETIDSVNKKFIEITQKVFHVNKYRSYKQDISFGVRKLIDIAIKAISPAVNDPTTCLNCIDYIGEIIRQLSVRKFPSTQTLELKNQKIYISEFDFKELVNFSFDQIYQWGKKDTVVVKRIIQTIYHILPCVLNPYNLMVLIKEIEDMELSKMYYINNCTIEHTNEQIVMVNKELEKFRIKAKEQIQRVKDIGIFKSYERKDSEINVELSDIRRIEIECLDYLNLYLHT